MKKFLLFTILFSCLNTYCPPVGPKIDKIKTANKSSVSVKFPKEGFYELRVLDQGYTGTCTRHAIRNLLIYSRVINAISNGKNPQAKNLIRQSFNKNKFNKFNDIICRHFGITDKNQSGLTGSQINKLLLNLNRLQRKYPRLKNILPKNLNQIMSNIVPVQLLPFDLISLLMISREQYKSDADLIKVLNGFTGRKELLKSVCNFKKSNKKVLGICLGVPTSISQKVDHAISVIIHKANPRLNKFEIFVLNSGHKAEWLAGAKFLKYLITLPVDKLESIYNSPELYSF